MDGVLRSCMSPGLHLGSQLFVFQTDSRLHPPIPPIPPSTLVRRSEHRSQDLQFPLFCFTFVALDSAAGVAGSLVCKQLHDPAPLRSLVDVAHESLFDPKRQHPFPIPGIPNEAQTGSDFVQQGRRCGGGNNQTRDKPVDMFSIFRSLLSSPDTTQAARQ
ncbi:hypothetical protein DPEC_G00211060 [Dallia pectoralis]|uniref:Uncharacterized protein n=1 Tax=Dallia pectoralis TaxID=75939 RepID=A0ACC2G6D3_DALPE|nr:hypothetical protein DPEC_G00211060 [Dallia pectoralis]